MASIKHRPPLKIARISQPITLRLGRQMRPISLCMEHPTNKFQIQIHLNHKKGLQPVLLQNKILLISVKETSLHPGPHQICSSAPHRTSQGNSSSLQQHNQ